MCYAIPSDLTVKALDFVDNIHTLDNVSCLVVPFIQPHGLVYVTRFNLQLAVCMRAGEGTCEDLVRIQYEYNGGYGIYVHHSPITATPRSELQSICEGIVAYPTAH